MTVTLIYPNYNPGPYPTGLAGWAIALIVVIPTVVLIIVITTVVLAVRKRKQRLQLQTYTQPIEPIILILAHPLLHHLQNRFNFLSPKVEFFTA